LAPKIKPSVTLQNLQVLNYISDANVFWDYTFVNKMIL